MFEENVKLSQFSNYKIGGMARYFFIANSLNNLYKAIRKSQSEKIPTFILGGGTNLLISDSGFQGLVIKSDFNFIHQNECLLTVGSGVIVGDLLNFCIEKNLSGLEWAGGLPGTVGGAIRGNAGAFKGEIKDSVVEVLSLKLGDLSIIKRNKKECNFGYRSSVFRQLDKKNNEMILSAILSLRKGDKKEIRQAIEDKIKWRQDRQPLEHPNIGSIFKNVDWKKVPQNWQENEEIKKHLKTDPFPVIPAATLIDKSGLKGVVFGGAMISPKHPNFIVNTLQASSKDVEKLIKLVKITVKDKFDINLEEEIIYV